MASLPSSPLICTTSLLCCCVLILSSKFSAAHKHTHYITKPGCNNTCGNVTIPYPFGVGSNCSLNSGFIIICNASNPYDLPRLKLASDDASSYELEVIGISESTIQVKTPDYTYPCQYKSSMALNFSQSPYTLSDTNVVLQLGCSDMAVLEGFSSQYLSPSLTQNNFASGCVSFCIDGKRPLINGVCPGNGCCQVPIPKGTVFINFTNSDLEESRWKRDDVPCSYSLIGEKEKFSHQPQAIADIFNNESSFTINDWLDNYVTITLDWRIIGGNGNCSQASKSGNFACQKNSLCIDDDTGIGGYRCSCRKGYEGNPYLAPGCNDIDECKKNPCHETGICSNSPAGSYTCGCPQGLYGSGWKDGAGCSRPRKSMTLMAKFLISGVVCAMSLLTGIPFYFGLKKYIKKRKNKIRRQQCFKQNGGLLLQQQIASSGQGTLEKTVIFSAKELEKATDNFNESRILGRGGQGTVYKGMLSDGQIVAIKKSQLVDEKKSESLVEQFINEVVILSQINHRNVVKLLGCCLETNVPLLVYEFVANGTLHQHIHEDRNVEFPISWSMRLKIAAEIAGALAYLHSATTLLIFHRDIKSSNILLDEKYVAKVSDFGASKTVAIDQTHLTTNVNGTFGYIDPEYFQSSQFTEKSDVYSFGVVLVELLTGLKPVIHSPRSSEHRSLVQHFLSSMNENNLDSILDSQVAAESEKQYPLAMARLAKRCLNLNGKKRPTMKAVAIELENIRMAQMGSVAQTRIARDEQYPSLHDQEGSPALLSTDIRDH